MPALWLGGRSLVNARQDGQPRHAIDAKFSSLPFFLPQPLDSTQPKGEKCVSWREAQSLVAYAPGRSASTPTSQGTPCSAEHFSSEEQHGITDGSPMT